MAVVGVRGWTDRMKLRAISPCSLSCHDEGGDIGEFVLGFFRTTVALEVGLRWWIRRSAAASLSSTMFCSEATMPFGSASLVGSGVDCSGQRVALWSSSDSLQHLCYSYRPRCKRGETIRQELLARLSFLRQALAAERERGPHTKW